MAACDSVPQRDDALPRRTGGASLGQFSRALPGKWCSSPVTPGAGKSTLLRLITADRAMHPRAGGGRRAQSFPPSQTRHIPLYRRHLGVVFQDHQTAPRSGRCSTTWRCRWLRPGIATARCGGRVRAALDLVGLLDKGTLAADGPFRSGEQQRVGIARAVVHRPSLLLADEPTGNLDPEAEPLHHGVVRALQPDRGCRGHRHPRSGSRSVHVAPNHHPERGFHRATTRETAGDDTVMPGDGPDPAIGGDLDRGAERS